MYQFQIKDIGALDWDRVESAYDSTCFHSRQWTDYLQCIGKKPFIAEIYEGNTLIGWFIGSKIWFGVTMICAPMDSVGTYSQGLCFIHEVTLEKRVDIYQAFAQWLFENNITSYIQIDDWELRFDTHSQNWVEYSDVRIPVLDNANLAYTTRATIHLPLYGKTEEELWSGLHYKSAKYSINKANKMGLYVKRINKKEDISAFTKIHFDQVSEVCARKGTTPKPSQQRSRMEALCNSLFPNRVLMLEVIGKDENGTEQIMSTAIWGLDKGECSFWTAASYQRYMKYCPNELMIWTAIKIMAQEGCGDLNFCGMADYKLKYGGYYAYIPHVVFTKYPYIAQLKDRMKVLYFNVRHYLQALRGKKSFK